MSQQPECLYEAALIAFTEGTKNPRTALILISQHLHSHPTDVQGWILKGDCHYCLDEDWLAAKAYTQAAKILTAAA